MRIPLVYIVILNWNGKEHTLACLQSLEKIKYPRYVVVVVDNASSDGSAEYISRNFPWTKLIPNTINLRYAGGNNIGIDVAIANNADYILLLNNDTIVDENFLTELVNKSESDPSIGMAGPKIYYYSHQNVIWFAGGGISWWSGWTYHNGIRKVDKGQFDKLEKVDYLTGCCLLVKREVIEKVGKLDESYFMYGEDVDWCVRASRAGFKLIYVPSSVIWHKVSASSGGNLSWFKNWNKLKSQIRLMCKYAKWYHWITIPFGLSTKILFSIIKAIAEKGKFKRYSHYT